MFLKHDWPGYEGAFKHSKLKTHWPSPVITFETEYRALAELHAQFPDNIATPVALVKSGRNRVSGYITEYIDGLPLYLLEEKLDFERMGIAEKIALYESILFLLRDIGGAGLAHGDPGNPGNIVIPKGGGVKLIDPMPDGQAHDVDHDTMLDLAETIFDLRRIQVEGMLRDAHRES
ncbi:MAG: hypothetical protein KGH72_03815 [Candidatus Micrarchaeota archaeon]|nr:hypothetical protein [Candidatus Micrarchaeota archaeon]